MNDIYFEIDWLALTLAAIFLFTLFPLWRLKHTFPHPQISFSRFKELSQANHGWRIRFLALPNVLMFLSLFLFLMAFIDPHFQIKRTDEMPSNNPKEGIAIYLVLDHSGSMTEPVTAVTQKGSAEKVSKMDLMKQFTQQFVLKRQNDLIGLVSFARTANVLVPLTLDHASILKKLETIQVEKNKENDGTAIGYAIFKTSNLIAATTHYAQELSASEIPAYEIKSSIIILVTDGFQAPNPLDKDKQKRNISLIEAAEYAKKQNIKLYIINVEPSFSSSEFGPHRRLMQRTAALTGGQFYMIGSDNSLDNIFADINKLEKSFLPTNFQNLSKDKQPHRYKRISLYPYLIALGMFCLFSSIVLKSTLMRQIP